MRDPVDANAAGYVVMTESPNEHHVIVLPAGASRGWVQIVATFSNRERAVSYAEIEQQFVHDDFDFPSSHLAAELKEKPSRAEPESILRRLKAALDAIRSEPTAVAATEPARTSAAPVSHGPAETSESRGGPARHVPGEVHGRTCEPTSPPNAKGAVESATQDAPLDIPTGARSAGPAGASPGEGPSAAPDQEEARDIVSGKGEQCAKVAGAGEDGPASVDPAPAPDARSQRQRIVDDLPALAKAFPGGASYSDLEARYGVPATSLGAVLLDLVRRGTLERVHTDRVRFKVRPQPTTELSAGDGEKGEAPASSPSLGVSSQTAGSSSSEAEPALSEESTKGAPTQTAPGVAPSLDGASVVSIGPIAVDETTKTIAGPRGVWQTHRPCLTILTRLAKLRHGQYLDAQALSAGTMAKARILESVPTWRRELSRIGIELGQVGENFYLKRAEIAA